MPGPELMNAAVLYRHGDLPAYADHPAPTRPDGGILVRVTAAPIVPLDLLCASGTSYFGAPGLPYVPGVQGVGIVVESASLPEGRRVWFATSAGMTPGDGSMAERCVVDANDVVSIDSGLDDAEVAAVGLSGVAAWMALTWRAELRAGETVVVLGASGAVGRSAVAAARQLGAGRVVAVSRRSASDLTAAGADAVVSTGTGPIDGDLTDRIADAAGGPVDVIVDPVFGATATAAFPTLGTYGRMINIGASGGDVAELSSAVLRSRSISVLGYTNNAISAAQRADALRAVLEAVAAHPGLIAPRCFPAAKCGPAWQAARTGPDRVVLLF
jgi:NADPH:quinone reductase-like Zn-dependent oxidoreductase